MPRTVAGQRHQVRDFGTCLSFSSGKNVTCATNVAFRPTSITLSCWVRPSSITGIQTYIRCWFNAGYIFRTDGSSHLQLQLNTNANKTLNGLTTPTLNVWHHFVATYNETTGLACIYIDGVLDNSTTHAGGAITYGTPDTLYLGNSVADEFLNGLEDDARIYSTDLSAAQVLGLYYGIEPPTTSLVSWYKLNEGSGTTAIDSSASALNGTITSATYSSNVFMIPRGVAGTRLTVSGISPNSISGLCLWLKADAMTSLNDNDTVATWTDSSGQGNNATQTNASFRPTFKTNIVNSKAVMRFSGSTKYFDLPDFASSFTSGEMFLVIKTSADPPAGAEGLYDFGTQALQNHYPFSDGSVYDGWGSTARKSTGNPTLSLASWRIYNISSQASLWTSRIDTVTHFSTATNTVGFPTALFLGASTGGGPASYFNGDIAEFIVYNAVLTASQRNEIEKYLSNKYAVTSLVTSRTTVT